MNTKVSYSDEYIDKNFEKVETEDGTFYKHKKINGRSHVAFPTSGYSTEFEDSYNELYNILQPKMREYMKKYTSEECPVDQKIEDDFYIGMDILSDESEYYKDNDLTLLVNIYAHPINGNSSYWKENFSNNELFYDEHENQYSVIMYYFVRLSKSKESGEYEIAYIDFKPENYDKYVSEIKNDKGVDLENLDIEKILNTEYVDEINVVASSNTVAVSADKLNYESEKDFDISNFSIAIRAICILFLIIMIIVCAVKKKKK